MKYNERVSDCHYEDGLSGVCVMHRSGESSSGVVGEGGWVEGYVLEKGSVNTGYNGG